MAVKEREGRKVASRKAKAGAPKEVPKLQLHLRRLQTAGLFAGTTTLWEAAPWGTAAASCTFVMFASLPTTTI